jgi:uncharacterized protein (TIGR02246 family)
VRRWLRRLGGAAALLAVVISAGCTLERRAADEDDGSPRAEPWPASDSAVVAREVEAMLGASAASWNAGDLEGFLDDYSDAPGLTFSGSSGVTRGKDAVRERYLASYWAPGTTRDSLRFQELEVRRLGGRHALVLGRYVLYRPAASDSVTAEGAFTLVLEREDEGWRIVHDHSS